MGKRHMEKGTLPANAAGRLVVRIPNVVGERIAERRYLVGHFSRSGLALGESVRGKLVLASMHISCILYKKPIH